MDIISFILAKRYTDSQLVDIEQLQGKSAYEIAVINGFEGTETEWLLSLQGITPHIGNNGHWFIGEEDTGILAAPDLTNYYSQENLIALTPEEILQICK